MGIWVSLLLNIVGGFLAAFIFWSISALIRSIKNNLESWRFKEIFGKDPNITLIYEEFILTNRDNPYPYGKADGGIAGFSINRPVSNCNLRSINYISNAIVKFAHITPRIRSDVETRSLLDLNFISFGGHGSNYKTADCLSNGGNTILTGADVWDKLGNRPPGYDYGIILKINPIQFPNRVWLSCFGFSEWGTSGAAWFLANKWDIIRTHMGKRNFVAYIRVRPDQDESTELLRIYQAENIYINITNL